MDDSKNSIPDKPSKYQKIESPEEIRRRLTGTEEPTEKLNLLALARILDGIFKRIGLTKIP
jgi:hypothetical protein